MPRDLLSQRAGDFGKPRRLGKYELVAPVCVDSLGETWAGYIAEGSEVGRMVLVTVAPFCTELDIQRRVETAAKKSITVRHPQVLAFLGTERLATEITLVSEYLEGEPLSVLLNVASTKSTPLPQGVSLRIALEAVETLSELRERDAVNYPHGGVCPEIIFVARFGEALLRHPAVTAHAIGSTQVWRHPGALPYRAPEQIKSPRSVSESSDVFSFGVLLWEMLANRTLFAGTSLKHLGRRKTLEKAALQKIEERVRGGEIPSLRNISRPGGALHPDVVALVDRMLSRTQPAGPQNLEQLADALSQLPSGLIAESAEVSAAVDRLAGTMISRRERELANSAHVPVFGSSPPSERVTARPDSDAERTVAVTVPKQSDKSSLEKLARSFDGQPLAPSRRKAQSRDEEPDSSRQTAPTRPRISEPEFESRPSSFPQVEEVTTKGRIPRLTPSASVDITMQDESATTKDLSNDDQDRRSAVAEGLVVAPEDTPDFEQQHATVAITPPPEPNDEVISTLLPARPSSPRKGVLLVALLLLTACSGAAFALLGGNETELAAESLPKTSHAVESPRDEGSNFPAATAESQPAIDDAISPPDSDVNTSAKTEEDPDAPVENKKAPLPRTAPREGTPTRQEKKGSPEKSESNSAGAFRPMGI